MNPPTSQRSVPRRGTSNNKFRGRWRGASTSARPPPKPTTNPLPFEVLPGPYKGWKLYFTAEAFNEGNTTHLKLQALESYINRHPDLLVLSSILEKQCGYIDIKKLTTDREFITDWNTFTEDLFENPNHVMALLGLAMHQSISTDIEKQTQEALSDAYAEQLPEISSPPLIRMRPINYEPITQLKHLKVNFYGKLVSIRGTVIRCGPAKLLARSIAWKCDSCFNIQSVQQQDGSLTAPTNCPINGCRSRKFHQLLSHPFTSTVDWQSIKLKETVENHQLEGGRIPRTIEVELSEDLLGSCVPGDDVTITGIVKVQNLDGPTSRNAASMFLLYLDAVSLVNDKKQAGAYGEVGGIEFANKDYYAIKKIHAEPGLLRLLVHSLCPTIFGQEIVKLGLLFGLFGGGIDRADTRADSHILMVGDPGLGKSQLLQACANVAPRGVYVCGNTSTSAGLTVSLSREAGGDFALEAGALILADQGICCIDEFDKMPTQHQALLEAMEQQTISIAKGGVVCTLNARCSVLAAANPVGGHYNKGKTVSENIRLTPALLSRFDLVFILLDQPDSKLDTLLSEHVLALHSSTLSNSTVHSISSSSSNTTVTDPNIPLKQRLHLTDGEVLNTIPACLLRKYIAYARKYVKTRLSPAAAEVLQTFYIQLRKQHQTCDSTPITARQLQALIRLTRARARLELRELATESDAMDVVEVMRHSLVDIFSDDFGNIDFTRSQNGTGVSSKSQVKKFLNILTRHSQQKQKSIFDLAEIKQVAILGNIQPQDVSSFIATLNTQGFLIKKGQKQYQILTTEY